MKAKRLMDCKKAQILIAPHILGDLENDPLRCGQLEAHLKDCPECTEMYEGFQATIGFVLEHRAEFAQASKKARERDEENAAQAESSANFVSNKGLIVKVSTIAACLVIGFGLFFTASQFKKPQNDSSPIASNQQQNPVRIELISGDSTEILPAGQLIIASNELKTLRINGNRQMVLNVGTELAIESYNLGCIVKLDQGEIYTEVEHDGKPFMVETCHGRAVIIGTTFNIKTDRDKMDLAVIEGSVRFEGNKGTVPVQGGYQSSIMASMQPTKPVACDVIQIAKWTQNQNAEITPLTIPTNTDISDLLELSLTHTTYRDMADIDFDVWIDGHREWFEREFPWTKRMQSLLAQEGTELDTVDLLIESGDLWRFTWPEHSQQRILEENRQIVQEMASRYGVKVDKLISKGALVQTKYSSSIEALERWSSAIDENKDSLIIDSIHAATFLINTRSLAWYAINSDYIQIQEKQQVLDMLAEQAKIASDMLGTLYQAILANEGESACSIAQCEEFIRDVKEEISSIIKLQLVLVEDK